MLKDWSRFFAQVSFLICCKIATLNPFHIWPSTSAHSVHGVMGYLDLHRPIADTVDSPNIKKRYRNDYDNEVCSFVNYKLARIVPHNKKSLEYLRQLFLTDNSPYELDFWQPPSHVGGLVDVTVAPEDVRAFFSDLDARKIEYIIVADNLQSLVINERLNYDPQSSSAVSEEDYYHYDRYNPLTTIEAQLFRLRDENPKLVTVFDIGKTHENRSIYTVKISSHTSRKNPWKSATSAIWIDGGIHAREWIAPATAMNLIRKLVNGFNAAEPETRRMVRSVDWYVTPVLNPDGYEYSHTKNRMWRKNRRPSKCKPLLQYNGEICCAGVDLNRNFDWHYATTGSSENPCHETYHGPSAFSEPESRAVRDFLQKIPARAFITLHSYSQLWLIPYGHKRQTYPKDFANVLRPLSVKATDAMNRLYGTKYEVGTGADLLYEASGASHDYARGSLKIPFSFLVELRPQNVMLSSGFLLPESEILATGEETWMAVKVVADEVINRFVHAPLPTSPPPKMTEFVTELPTTTPTTTVASTTESPAIVPSTTEPSTTMYQLTAMPQITIIPFSERPPRPVGRSNMGGTYRRRTFRPLNITVPSSSTTTISSSRETAQNALEIVKNMPTSQPLGSSEMELFLMIGVRAGKPIAVVATSQTGHGQGLEKPEESNERPRNGPEPSPRTAGITVVSSLPFVETISTISIPLSSPTPLPSSAETGTTKSQKTVVCHDFSHYCKWWKIHRLCDRPQVYQKCSLSCLPECQI